MCNKNLKLKSPLRINRPSEFIEAPVTLTLPFFLGGGGVTVILNLIFRRVG